MASDIDEPRFSRPSGTPGDTSAADLEDRLRALLLGQPYAVLSTQGQGQPYASLVAVAFSEDLRWAAFATPVSTRKARLLEECPQVALLVDDRPQHPRDVMDIQAVTVTGRAVLVEGESRHPVEARLLAAHPYLEEFLAAPTCVLYRVDVTRAFHVMRFQEVSEWTPSAG